MIGVRGRSEGKGLGGRREGGRGRRVAKLYMYMFIMYNERSERNRRVSISAVKLIIAEILWH